MARKSFESQARELAATKGIKLDVEVDNEYDYSVEIWAFDAHYNFDDAHTCIPSMQGYGLKSKAQVWQQVLRDLEQFEPCEKDCSCYTD